MSKHHKLRKYFILNKKTQDDCKIVFGIFLKWMCYKQLGGGGNAWVHFLELLVISFAKKIFYLLASWFLRKNKNEENFAEKQ